MKGTSDTTFPSHEYLTGTVIKQIHGQPAKYSQVFEIRWDDPKQSNITWISDYELYNLGTELIRALNKLRLNIVEIHGESTITINANLYNDVMDILSLYLGEPLKGATYTP